MTRYELKKLLRYHPSSGLFYWLEAVSNVPRGSIAGTVTNTGYLIITVQRQHYKAHRLIWLYLYNRVPEVIDHINLDKLDNRLVNLRECTQSQNQFNSIARNKSGVKGVEKDGNQWRAKATLGGKFHHLGMFPTKELAAEAYNNFARENHGEYARVV